MLERPMLTFAQAGQLLGGRKARHIARMVREGVLKAVVLSPGRKLIHPDEIDRLIGGKPEQAS